MNKKIKTYFEQLGLKIEGNNAYGDLYGYEVSANVAMLDQVSPVRIHVSFHASDEAKRLITNDLRDLKFKYFTYATDMYGITLGFNDPLTVGKLLKRMPDMLNKIFEVFNKYEVKGLGFCPVCGEQLPEDAKKYRIEWSLISIDNNCISNLNQVIEAENQDFKEAPNNYLKGTFGALLGALVGAVAFIILFLIGYVSAITSLIAILLGTYLYKKLGGKPNAVMVVIVSITSISSMLLTLWGLYILIAQALVFDYNFTSTGMQAFNDMMTIPEFKSEFTTNLAMTFMFTMLGVVYQIIQLSKSVKRQSAIK
jgi:hypothetical protein